MNRSIISRINIALFMILILVCFKACKKDDEPVNESKSPLATTTTPAWVGRQWATLKGQVNGRKQLTTVIFDWDTSSTYRFNVSPVPDTTTSGSLVAFSVTITDLTPKTKYHFRIRAENEYGTANGADLSFTTGDTTDIVINFNPDLVYDSIYDSDGNKYRTIQIGTQTWMAENLKSVRLNDGTDIPFVMDVSAWASTTTPAYCWFNNDSVGYGALYNWYTVNTGKICPEGWHVPSDDEWTILTDYLGGKSIAGGKLKETGTSHWASPNSGATNESGFTGLPAGYRNYLGTFNAIAGYGVWWTSTEWSSTAAWYRDVYYGYGSVDRSNSHKKSGATVRCVKD